VLQKFTPPPPESNPFVLPSATFLCRREKKLLMKEQNVRINIYLL